MGETDYAKTNAKDKITCIVLIQNTKVFLKYILFTNYQKYLLMEMAYEIQIGENDI